MDPKAYQCLALAKALELYAHTKMKVNRLYTPTNMMRTASTLTGQQFKRGDYLTAAKALRDLLTPQP